MLARKRYAIHSWCFTAEPRSLRRLSGHDPAMRLDLSDCRLTLRVLPAGSLVTLAILLAAA